MVWQRDFLLSLHSHHWSSGLGLSSTMFVWKCLSVLWYIAMQEREENSPPVPFPSLSLFCLIYSFLYTLCLLKFLLISSQIISCLVFVPFFFLSLFFLSSGVFASHLHPLLSSNFVSTPPVPCHVLSYLVSSCLLPLFFSAAPLLRFFSHFVPSPLFCLISSLLLMFFFSCFFMSLLVSSHLNMLL